MLELDSALAQHIVDRAMAILPYNINVMDAQGMIIGSGDPARLHTRHEGAQLVLANRRVVEIDEQAAACLRGVRPGVNLPLLHADQLIGVLGITGAPDTVRPYAELVRMAAEMLVEQRQLQAERHWQRHQLETWLRQIADSSINLTQLQAEAERIGLQLAWPRQLLLLELAEEGDQARALSALAGKAEQCGPFGVRQLLLCRPYQSGRDAAWLAQLDSRGLGVQRLLCSDELHGFADLREAALALRDLHAYAKSRQPELRVLRLPDHRLQAFLHGRRQDWSVQRWLAPLRRVLAQDSQGQLRQTLLAWCRHDGHPQACADELGIHRNTLRYRLERIGELSGLDLTRRDQRLLFTLGLELLDD